MRLIINLLIFWPCLGLTMEQPTPYSLLYSDVNACTRYNFLPINAKNFREAILFFNLCQQLVHLLPENQQRNYVKHLRHEIIMTKNEFKSKNDNKDIGEWLDARLDSLVQELNKLESDTRVKSNFKLESFWPMILPFGRMHFGKNDQTETLTPRYASRIMTIQADKIPHTDHTSRYQDYNEMDQDDDLLMAEEKVNINDIALIGLVLGLVSSVSAAMTLLYICYCGVKRAKKKVISGGHQKGETNDKEKLIGQKNSHAAVDTQVSTKIAKYTSGECKLNKSDGHISEYQSFEVSCPTERNREYHYENNYSEELSMADNQHGENTYEIETDYENHQRNSQNPEVTSINFSNQEVNSVNKQAMSQPNKLQEPGYPRNGQLTKEDQSYLEYYAAQTDKLGQHTKSKNGYGDSGREKLTFNNISQQKLNENKILYSTTVDKKDIQKGFTGDDIVNDPSFSYIQQKYSKGHASLMNSHFPCDMQSTQLQQEQKSNLFRQSPPLEPVLDQQKVQQQLQQDLEKTTNSERKTVSMSTGGNEPLIYGSTTLRNGENQENSKCKNCNRPFSSKKRQGFTCENIGTPIQMQMEASQNDSGLNKTSAAHCDQTDSENIMQQERFLCSLSATTPLTTKEPCWETGDKNISNKEGLSEQICIAANKVAKNISHPAIGDLSSNIQKPIMDKHLIASPDCQLINKDTLQIAEQKQYYMSLHSPAVKKYHRQKCAHPKSSLTTPLPPKKKTQKMMLQENDSSYYSVKPSSPYQSCAEVNPFQTSKLNQNANTAENVFAPNMHGGDIQKTLEMMFKRNSSRVKKVNNDQETLLTT